MVATPLEGLADREPTYRFQPRFWSVRSCHPPAARVDVEQASLIGCMDLIDHLETLAARAEQTGESLTNEEATKMALIAPFIQALGYDIFNPTEVKPEFSADLPGIK